MSARLLASSPPRFLASSLQRYEARGAERSSWRRRDLGRSRGRPVTGPRPRPRPTWTAHSQPCACASAPFSGFICPDFGRRKESGSSQIDPQRGLDDLVADGAAAVRDGIDQWIHRTAWCSVDMHADPMRWSPQVPRSLAERSSEQSSEWQLFQSIIDSHPSHANHGLMRLTNGERMRRCLSERDPQHAREEWSDVAQRERDR
jgi:hypothetical protein